MSSASNNQGRAYEYIWVQTLFNALPVALQKKTEIEKNSSFYTNQNAWDSCSSNIKSVLKISAEAAVDTILELEPKIFELNSGTLIFEFQKDNEGTDGDVRDILIKRDSIEWEVGLSIKHNHEAVKHSRLSSSIDFAKNWYGGRCSNEYWDVVKPIFSDLEKRKQRGQQWSDLKDKLGKVYQPILKAFLDEINRSNTKDKNVPRKLVEYLIGKEDFYKVISQDKNQITLVETFNVHSSLNQPSSIKKSQYRVPNVKLPTEIVCTRFKSGSKTTVEIYLNNGWQLSFRLHNASKIIEPSLKFDVQLIGTPITILTIKCRWKS